MTATIDKIREKILTQASLKMSRVPPKTYKRFLEISQEEFCEDRGMTLKYLIDIHDGLITTGVEHIEMEINQIRARLDALEQKTEEKKPVRRTLSGKPIGVKGNE